MTEEGRYRTCDGVDLVDIAEDETVARNAARTQAVVLNATASAVLDLCDGTHTSSDIARFLHDALPTCELSQVLSDVEAILEELRVADIVTVVAG